MTGEDLSLLHELRKLLGPQSPREGTNERASLVWTELLEPALRDAVAEALAGMSNLTLSPAERGDYARSYHLAKKLADLLPDRRAQLERQQALEENGRRSAEFSRQAGGGTHAGAAC